MWCEEDFGGSSVVLCQADSFEEVLVVVERLLDRLLNLACSGWPSGAASEICRRGETATERRAFI
jgi:hypothetical protein